MSSNNLAVIVRNKLKIAILIGLFLGALSFLLLVSTQKNFKANTDILVVSNQQGFSDYYALSKSADYLSGILIESLHSEKFIDEVQNTNIISSKFLPEDKIERLNEWQKMVAVKKNSNVGIISVAVYGDTPRQTSEVSNAVLNVLTNQSSFFLGKGQDIEIKVLSGPIVEKNPTLFQIAMVSAGGFMIGILLVLMWGYYEFENKKSVKVLNGNHLDSRNNFVYNPSEKMEHIESLEFNENIKF
jgi:capsular polysaccharide biosynthesis protein